MSSIMIRDSSDPYYFRDRGEGGDYSRLKYIIIDIFCVLCLVLYSLTFIIKVHFKKVIRRRRK